MRTSIKQIKTLCLVVNAILLGWCLTAPLAQSVRVEAIDAMGVTVADMERSLAFYTNVLSFKPVSDIEVAGATYEHLQGVFGLRLRVVRLQLGHESVVLSQYLTPKGRPFPIDARSNDRWFQHIAIIVSDMNRAYQWLRRHQVEHVSPNPQRLPDWNPEAGGIQAFYFKDPDGHTLEILQFPPGKGDPKWHLASDKLFLGIDHTAIVVGNTAASLHFYRDVLGMEVVGESENYGIEQERLNNVFGARLHITALRTATGPGIEFLEYLTPCDGRPVPADARANDLIHWQTTLATHDLESLAGHVRAGAYSWISSGIMSVPNHQLGFAKGVLVRDPDGHVMQLVEK